MRDLAILSMADCNANSQRTTGLKSYSLGLPQNDELFRAGQTYVVILDSELRPQAQDPCA